MRRKNNHWFLYDEPALRRELEEAGFEDVRTRGCGESDIADIADVDLPDPFAAERCPEAARP